MYDGLECVGFFVLCVECVGVEDDIVRKLDCIWNIVMCVFGEFVV